MESRFLVSLSGHCILRQGTVQEQNAVFVIGIAAITITMIMTMTITMFMFMTAARIGHVHKHDDGLSVGKLKWRLKLAPTKCSYVIFLKNYKAGENVLLHDLRM